MLHGSGRVIHGDSAFASIACCTALLEHGLYFSGLLKTAHKEFPKKYCQDIAFQAGAQRGDTVTICTTKAILEVPLSSYMVMCGMSLEVKVLRRRLL